jgi:hypothetical protein
VHLAFDIFQGIGIAIGLGIRPFIPALAVSALASGDVQIHFNHGDYSFLQSTPFLLAVVLCAVAVAVIERQLSPESNNRELFENVLLAAGLVLAALLFAGALAQHHHAAWPGWLGGIACALLAAAASRPLFGRVRARLDRQAANAIILYAEASALLVAVLAAVAPPVGPVALLLVLWLSLAGRRREGQKYAGLRILR